ncbi:YdcF family protein [Nocardia sp. CC227C]|uniref:YdcF family protein n=1 Tax=Nocardia sp. CC227C TaxID=3044562 RepID=UPI00278C0F74|nr:YdcF family protein [Nocardia sp. CC227C]
MRLSRRTVTAIALLCAAVVYVGALWPVFVRPRVDTPRPADAILVLGGAHDGREELGLGLAHDGVAPLVLISDPYEHSPLVNRICHGGYSFAVECFDPEPRTTRGEGRYLAERARAEGWRRVIVVTFTPHISRTRYILGKCWDGELLVVDARPRIGPLRWMYQYAYQTAGYLKAFAEDC